MTVENISLNVTTNAANAAKQFRSLSAALSGVQNAGKSISHGSTSATKSVSSVSHAAKNATKQTNQLFGSLKRIAMYRLLRTMIKDVAKAFQEGLTNAYNFSRGINGTLSVALDQLAMKSQTMKNQLGAAFGNLLQIIQPIVLQIISLITQLASAISALLSAFGGGQYLVAKDVATSWDKATGAAKKYKNTIFGFDEINRLNDETGGGGGKTADANSMFEVGILPDWAQQIKDAFERGSWADIGAIIGRKINDAVDSADFSGVGKKLGEKINNIFTGSYFTLRTIDFSNIGAQIAGFLNSAISQINSATIGRTLVRKFTSGIDALIGFVQKFDVKQLATRIGEFIRGAANEATNWIKSKDWKDIGETLITKIGEFFEGLELDKTAESISVFLGAAIRAAIQLLTPFVDILIEKWNTEIQGASFEETMSNLFEKIGDGLGDVVGWVRDHIIKPFLDTLLEKSEWARADEFKYEILLFLNTVQFAIEGSCLKIGWVLEDLGRVLKDVKEQKWDKLWSDMELLVSDASVNVSDSATAMAESVTQSMMNGETDTSKFGQNFKDTMIDVREETRQTIIGFEDLDTGADKSFGNAGDALFTFSSDYASMIDSLTTSTNNSLTPLQNFWDKITGILGTLGQLSGFSTTGGGLIGLIQGKGWNFNIHDVLGFADGGMPETGSLFVAGERGAEIVSNLGNGKTGVTNVEQMEAAVANGNENVVNAVYAMANMIVKAVDGLDLDVSLDGQSLADKMYHYNKQAATRYGAAMVSVG